MKSLAERHADRLQRKADNSAFSAQSGGGDIGLAAVRIGEAQAAIAALSPEQRSELRELVSEDGFSDAVAEADANAYDAQGNLKTAGVGVTNPLIAPVAAAMANEGGNVAQTPQGGAEGNGGWGTIPEPTVTPEQGNQGGVALEGQAGGNAPQGDAMRPPVSASMKVAELEAIASKEGADLSNANNNADRVTAIEANRAKSA